MSYSLDQNKIPRLITNGRLFIDYTVSASNRQYTDKGLTIRTVARKRRLGSSGDVINPSGTTVLMNKGGNDSIGVNAEDFLCAFFALPDDKENPTAMQINIHGHWSEFWENQNANLDDTEAAATFIIGYGYDGSGSGVTKKIECKNVGIINPDYINITEAHIANEQNNVNAPRNIRNIGQRECNIGAKTIWLPTQNQHKQILGITPNSIFVGMSILNRSSRSIGIRNDFTISVNAYYHDKLYKQTNING